tara:strand:- start:1288 stop:1578 length:291 start_codon:yes stop_codon:yes gene_type:complete
MNVFLASMMLTTSPEVPEIAQVEVAAPMTDSGEMVKKCEDDVRSLKNGVLGLEFFLKDKKYHERVCPNLEWKQPSLEIYKEHPKSYLPEECPRDVI